MNSSDSQANTRVAIVEDIADICEGLEYIIGEAPDFSVVCSCRNVETALKKIPACSPDVVLMDINLPDGSGIDCISKLKSRLIATQFLIFTIHEDTDLIFKALQAGASGYLLKRTAPDALVQGLREGPVRL